MDHAAEGNGPPAAHRRTRLRAVQRRRHHGAAPVPRQRTGRPKHWNRAHDRILTCRAAAPSAPTGSPGTHGTVSTPATFAPGSGGSKPKGADGVAVRAVQPPTGLVRSVR